MKKAHVLVAVFSALMALSTTAFAGGDSNVRSLIRQVTEVAITLHGQIQTQADQLMMKDQQSGKTYTLQSNDKKNLILSLIKEGHQNFMIQGQLTDFDKVSVQSVETL